MCWVCERFSITTDEAAQEVESAEQKARRLLRAHLRGRQRWTLRYRKYIDVEASDGSRWRIACQPGITSGNVYELITPAAPKRDLIVEPQIWQGHCIVVRYDIFVPDADAWLAQYLLLTANKNKFRNTALPTGRYQLRDWDGYLHTKFSHTWVSPYIY